MLQLKIIIAFGWREINKTIYILQYFKRKNMEVDQESCSGDYKRKQDDLKQMIRHAKLNPKNITTICQV